MSAINPERIKAAEIALKRKKANRVEAERQAAKDEAVKPSPPDVTLTKGQQVPLHILNLRNREVDRHNASKARDAARAAAVAVHKTLNPTAPTTPEVQPGKVAGPQTAALEAAATKRKIAKEEAAKPAPKAKRRAPAKKG